MSLAEECGMMEYPWHEVYVNGNMDHHEPGAGAAVYERLDDIYLHIDPANSGLYKFKIEDLPESRTKDRYMECDAKAEEMYGSGYREISEYQQFNVRLTLGFVRPGLRRRGE